MNGLTLSILVFVFLLFVIGYIFNERRVKLQRESILRSAEDHAKYRIVQVDTQRGSIYFQIEQWFTPVLQHQVSISCWKPVRLANTHNLFQTALEAETALLEHTYVPPDPIRTVVKEVY